MFSANIFTLYPEIFPGALGYGIYQRAFEKKIWELNVKNIRDYAYDKHATVDDKPFGGGSGMVLKADVLNECLEKNSNDYKTYYLSPRGKVFNQELANEFSKSKPYDIQFCCLTSLHNLSIVLFLILKTYYMSGTEQIEY